MTNDSDDPKEIVSLSKELMSFDVTDMSAEELERRLELAIGEIVPVSCCGSDCPGNCPCNNCPVNCCSNCSVDCHCNCVVDVPIPSVTASNAGIRER